MIEQIATVVGLAASAAMFTLLLLLSWAVVRERPAPLTEEPEPPTTLVFVRARGNTDLAPDEPFDLRSGDIVGSGHDADIVVQGATVQPEHARFWWDGQVWVVTPRGGDVAVNDVPIGADRALSNGDTVSIGDLLFRLARRRAAR